jgi:hypothetical protein
MGMTAGGGTGGWARSNSKYWAYAYLGAFALNLWMYRKYSATFDVVVSAGASLVAILLCLAMISLWRRYRRITLTDDGIDIYRPSGLITSGGVVLLTVPVSLMLCLSVVVHQNPLASAPQVIVAFWIDLVIFVLLSCVLLGLFVLPYFIVYGRDGISWRNRLLLGVIWILGLLGCNRVLGERRWIHELWEPTSLQRFIWGRGELHTFIRSMKVEPPIAPQDATLPASAEESEPR